MSIIPNEIKNFNKLNEFFIENIKFKVLQVRKTNGTFSKVKKESIINSPFLYDSLQVNFNGYINALAFDCDHEDVLLYSDFNLPTPSITTVNKINGKHHHLYFLEAPVPLLINNSSKKYLSDIIDGLTYKLNADSKYTGILTKNFLNHEEFKLFGNFERYSLEDFKDYSISNFIEKEQVKLHKTSFSRHITLFDELRFFGYSIAKNCSSEKQLYFMLEKHATSINNSFEEKIKIKYILKSVCSFCWKNKENFSSSKWNWNYKKKTKEEVRNSHKERWKRERAERLKKRFLELY